MRIVYAIPGPMSRGPMGLAEMRRRENLLSSWAFPGTSVSVRDALDGPNSIESAYEEALSTPAGLDLVKTVVGEGADAVIIGCAGDPGLEAARELVDVPVIGPGEASILLACSLGHKFSVIGVFDGMQHGYRLQAFKAGCVDKFASMRASNVAVLDLMNDRENSLERVIAAGRAALEHDGADTLILGCMTMSFLGIEDAVADALGVPVVNAGRAALKMAEMLAGMDISHSRRAYPRPPKFQENAA